jgi:KaiC/GvpD/RAD55 family RecA-like ATPase
MSTLTKFYRFTESVELSGRLIPEDELNIIAEGFQEKVTQRPAYTSVYSYGADAVDYFNTHYTTSGHLGSLSGYEGLATANHLIFDLDSEDLNKSLEDALTLVNRLLDTYKFNQDSISVFFSGGKGFHIQVKVSDVLTNDQLKSICSHIAKGLDTFDPKIYNKTRLIRMVSSKHEKTGLYKVELPLSKFLVEGSVDDFKEYARTPQDVFEHTPSFLSEDLLNLAPVNNLANIKVESLVQDITELNFGLKPADMPYCKYAILNGFFPEGSRNECIYSMAAYYKSKGYPMEVTNQNLGGIIEVQEKRHATSNHFSRREIWETVNSVYSPNYKGGVPNCKTNSTIKAICVSTGMHEHCSGSIKDNLGVQTIEQLDDSYVKYINSLSTSLIKTGISFIDNNIKLIKGTSNYIAGRSGSGKTNLILSTFKNTNKSGVNSIFFSADTSAIIVYQRMVASVTGLTQQQVEDAYTKKDKKQIAEFKKKVSEVYGRTTFNVKSTLTMEIIRDSITEVETQLGAPIDFVVIDYNERVMNQFSDPLNSVRHTALNLVDLSREMNKCFLTIAQVSRTKGSERTPLLSKNAAKESGAVEESASSLLTIWRPLYGSESLIGHDEDNYIGICVAKNRMGREGISSILYFDGSRSDVRDASDSEKYKCKQFMQELLEAEAEKNEKDNGSY